MKDILLQEGQKLHAKMCEINDYIYANPELGNEEFKSSDLKTNDSYQYAVRRTQLHC